MKALIVMFRPTVLEWGVSCLCQVWPALWKTHSQSGSPFYMLHDDDVDIEVDVDDDVDGPGANEFHPGHCELQPQPHLLPMVPPHCKWANISIMRMNMVMIMLMKMKMILVMDSIYQIGTSWESFSQINHDEQTMSSVISVQSQTATLCLPMPPPTSSSSSWPTSSSTWSSTSPWSSSAGRGLPTGCKL